jgi:hypothetical protein
MAEPGTLTPTGTLDTTAEIDFGPDSQEQPKYLAELVPIKANLFKPIGVRPGQNVSIGRKEEFGTGCFFNDSRISTLHCTIIANDDNTITLCDERYANTSAKY